MESERRINWLSLFIKVIIIFIFALIIIWLVSKLIGKNKLSETFTNNINNMEKVSIEYFKTVDLPIDKGKSMIVTLGELIDKELIVSVNNDSENTCDTTKSYSKIKREKNKYSVETTLKCGKEKDTIKTDFRLEDCINCNVKKENGNSNSNLTNEKEDTIVEGTTYYEHAKETTTYTKWMRGSITGNNVENKYEYYGIDNKTYYSIGVIPSNKELITYTIKLNKVPNEKYYFMSINEVEDFNINEKINYINEKDVSIYNDNTAKIPQKNIEKYSLSDSNITYKLFPYYRKGSFYIRITIKLNNTDGVKTYYDEKMKKDAYLIPLKINIKFVSNEISETKPSGKYETISYYRYVTTNRETIWSIDEYVEGYKKTGNKKIQ